MGWLTVTAIFIFLTGMIIPRALDKGNDVLSDGLFNWLDEFITAIVIVILVLFIVIIVISLFFFIKAMLQNTAVTPKSLIIQSLFSKEVEVNFTEIIEAREISSKINYRSQTLNIITRDGVIHKIKNSSQNYQNLLALFESNQVNVITSQNKS